MGSGVVGVAHDTCDLPEDYGFAYVSGTTDMTFNTVINFLQYKHQVFIIDADYETKQAITIGDDEGMMKFHLDLIKLFGPFVGVKDEQE